MSKEIKTKVEFSREETFKDGKKQDDYITVRYYPNEENKWSYTSFILPTNELEMFARAILAEVNKLKETETAYMKSPIFQESTEPKIMGAQGKPFTPNPSTGNLGGIGGYGEFVERKRI